MLTLLINYLKSALVEIQAIVLAPALTYGVWILQSYGLVSPALDAAEANFLAGIIVFASAASLILTGFLFDALKNRIFKTKKSDTPKDTESKSTSGKSSTSTRPNNFFRKFYTSTTFFIKKFADSLRKLWRK